jgi:hypothetical protein
MERHCEECNDVAIPSCTDRLAKPGIATLSLAMTIDLLPYNVLFIKMLLQNP